MIRQLQFAFRQLIKNPAFSTVAVLTLANRLARFAVHLFDSSQISLQCSKRQTHLRGTLESGGEFICRQTDLHHLLRSRKG